MDKLRVEGEIPDIMEECCHIVYCSCGKRIELSPHVYKLYMQGGLELTCPDGHKMRHMSREERLETTDD